jgi:acetolactate synthase-1/2/3 large subunit
MNAAEISTVLATAIAQGGGDTAFGMPGGGNNLDFIGAVEAVGMRFVLAHAETPAAIMASVYADLTDRPTACVITRGPGAASAVNGAANAMLDRQPVIIVADAVDSAAYPRIAHQRFDQLTLFAPIVKWAVTLGSERTDKTAEHAVRLSMTQPRGPVFLNFDPPGKSPAAGPPTEVAAAIAALPEDAVDLISRATRPVILLGVGARHVRESVRSLVKGTNVPVLTTYRAKGLVPDSWPNAAGMLTGATMEAPLLESADLILMVGVDTVEFIPNAWPYEAPVISLAAWAETSPYISSVLEIVGDLDGLVRDATRHLPETTWTPEAAHQHRAAETQRLLAGPSPVDGLAPETVVQRARALAPAGTIATVDAGAHMLPAMELWDVENEDEALISSGLATMGFAVPAAIAAALARPGRRVVCFVGDGGLGMTLGELETIRRYDLTVTVVVFNDSRLSLIAVKAKPEGNGGDAAVTFRAIDFAAVATAYGFPGVRVATVDELDRALSESFSDSGPSLIDARVDPRGYAHILNAVRGKR